MGTFAVDVQGATYEVDAPDGKTAWKWANAAHAKTVAEKPAQFVPSGEREQPSLLSPEGVASNPLIRFAVGAASPILGAAQIVGKIPGPGPQALARLVGGALPQLESMITSGRKTYQDSEGVDIPAIAGNVLSPVGLAASKVVKPAAGALGRISQGAGIGAGFGLTTPVTDEKAPFLETKALQTGVGAAVGGALSGSIEGAKAIFNLVNNVTGPMREAWRTQAGRAWVLDTIFGGDKTVRAKAEQAINTAMQSDKPMTVADAVALANVGKQDKFGSGLVAMEDRLTGMPAVADAAKSVEATQEAGRRSALSFAQDEAAVAAAESARAQSTGQMRETALAAANTSGVKGPELASRVAARQAAFESAIQDRGRFQTGAAQQENLAHGGTVNLQPRQTPYDPFNVGRGGGQARSPSAYPVEGMPRVPGRYTENAQRVPENIGAAADTAEIAAQRQLERNFAEWQLRSLERHGLTALESSGIERQIGAIANKPGFRASDVVTKTLSAVKDKIAALTNESGVIDARDLYTIRKEVGNTIGLLAKETNNWDKRLTAGLEKNIQGMIDEAITKAGGTGWRDYLKSFAEQSRAIDQMKVGQVLRNALGSGRGGSESQSAFETAIRNAPTTLKRASTGAARYAEGDLSKALTQQQMSAVDTVSRELARDAERAALGKGVNANQVFGIAEEGKQAIKLPNLLSRPAMVTNWVMHIIGQGADEAIAKDMAVLMVKNPLAFGAKYLKDVPVQFRSQVFQDLVARYRPAAIQAAVASQQQAAQ